MSSEDSNDCADDNDSNTTIFSTSSRGSAITLMSLPTSELERTFQCHHEDLEEQGKIALQLVDGMLNQRRRVLEFLSDDPRESRSYLLPSEVPSTLENRILGLCPKMSFKEYCRRVRKTMTKEDYYAFLEHVDELNELQAERERRAIVPKMSPLIFGCWPEMPIKLGSWDSPEFIGRIDDPPPKEGTGPVVKIRIPESGKQAVPVANNCCPRYCDPPAPPDLTLQRLGSDPNCSPRHGDSHVSRGLVLGRLGDE